MKSSEMNQEQIDNNFKHHEPSWSQADTYVEIRNTAKVFAELINKKCPKSRELSIALTKLEESVMWANTSIARNS